jgi:hypothetical protein
MAARSRAARSKSLFDFAVRVDRNVEQAHGGGFDQGRR